MALVLLIYLLPRMFLPTLFFFPTPSILPSTSQALFKMIWASKKQLDFPSLIVKYQWKGYRHPQPQNATSSPPTPCTPLSRQTLLTPSGGQTVTHAPSYSPITPDRRPPRNPSDHQSSRAPSYYLITPIRENLPDKLAGWRAVESPHTLKTYGPSSTRL